MYLSVSGLHEDLAVHEGNLAAKNNPAQATFHLQKLSFKIAEQNANCRAKDLVQLVYGPKQKNRKAVNISALPRISLHGLRVWASFHHESS